MSEIEGDLAELARAYGVALDYWDQAGQFQSVARPTVVAVLEALGADPSSPEGIAASLDAIRLRDWRRPLPPIVVAVQGRPATAWVHLPHGSSVAAWVTTEAGDRVTLSQAERWVEPLEVDGRLTGEATFVVPADLPLGWHMLHAVADGREEACPLVVTPERLEPAALQGDRRLWGFMAQIYSVRSQRSWGVGDLADLADLVSWSGHVLGADFVLVNPLHASSPVPPLSASPYLPSTRRFPNPLYLRVEDVPEFSYVSTDDRRRINKLGKGVRGVTSSLLDRDASWSAKSAALDIVREVPRTPGRAAMYDAFVAREGIGLVDMATWCALAEEHGSDWTAWPEGLRHPRAAEVEAWREEHTDRVERHLWLQWLLDEQLTTAQRAATDAGMSAGIVHDLAVGVTYHGADAWALQDVLVTDVSVGAPPDMYNQLGQDWGQPPWDPRALADAAFIPYRDMLRTVLRHAGGLRIDHVLGLFRMWWVPRGLPANQGTFVTFDHEAMIGILLLEAHRAGAFVIGEDLGTVEPWVQDVLRDRGILGTSILWFERWEGGALKLPEHWRRDVLASVTVHDLPPTAGFLGLEHVRIRSELGLLTRPVAEERAVATAEIEEWVGLARERGMLGESDDSIAGMVLALHRLLASSPARLLGISLPDAVGDVRAQNQPGTDQEYPNWRVPLTDPEGRPVALEELADMPLTLALVEALRGTP